MLLTATIIVFVIFKLIGNYCDKHDIDIPGSNPNDFPVWNNHHAD